MLESGSNCANVGKLTITLTQEDGKWTVDKSEGELIDCSTVTPDPDFLARFKELDEKSLALAGKEIGEVGETFMDPVYQLPGIPRAIIEDNPITDLVNIVQMTQAEADVSLAALFTEDANLEKGPFLNRDSVKIYKYDNTLFGVKVTGAQLKAIMEAHAGNFFNQYKEGDVTISFNPEMRMYNYDMFAGVNYEIDISKPAGERIVNVTYKGEPLKDDQELKLALNNYRYGGLVTAGLINEADVYYEGGAVRDMISDYVAALSEPLMPVCDNNWKIVGAPLDDPQKDLIYEKVRAGEISIPTSEDGRTPNVAALNGPTLRAEGKLPALDGETATAPAAPAAPATPATPAPDAKLVAYAATQNVDVDGKAVEFQMYALKDVNGNPTNFVKARDVASVLNGTKAQFEVGYDANTKAVTMTPNTAYTPNGSEMKTPFSGDRAYTIPTAKTNVGGKETELTAILLTGDTGGGFTYYRLRDLGEALGFNVSWSKEKGVFIESDKPYVG